MTRAARTGILTLAVAACAAGARDTLWDKDPPGAKAGDAGPPQTGASSDGVWIGRETLARLPTRGAAWARLSGAANLPALAPTLADQEDRTNIVVFAKALVAARTGDAARRQEVINAITAVMGTERGARALAVGRKLPTYVIAADLVRLPPDLDPRFRAWLRTLLDEKLAGRSLRQTNETRPNNWGTHAGAARAAIAAYLGWHEELERTAHVFHGWLGARSVYAGFVFGDLSWQVDPAHPVGVNPAGASRDGHSIDGVLPDDQRRSGPFRWPPPHENYVYEALQGALAEAVILSRAGYDVWSWEDSALLRAYRWLYDEAHFPAQGDDTWQLPIVDGVYGTHYWTGAAVASGKNIGFTDWTHGSSP